MKDKIKAKIEEGRLQTKLGSMEAKDKYVEIKDLAEDKIDAMKSKVDDTIAPNVKEKAEELKLEAEIKAEELKEEFSEKKEEAKKKLKNNRIVLNLRRCIESTSPNLVTNLVLELALPLEC